MVKGGEPKKENMYRDKYYRKYLWRWGRSIERKSFHSWGKPSIVDGESCGDRLFIGGPSLSDSTPLLRSSASHILADGWSTLRLAAFCAFCTPRLKGAANLPVHSIAHVEPWAWLCTPPAPPEAGPLVVVILAGALSLLEPLWGRRLGPSPSLCNPGAALKNPNPCKLIKNTNIA